MKHISIIIIVLLLSVLGCKKEASVFKIKGTVVNKQLQEKISGVRVYIDAKKIEGGVYNNSFTNVASTTTNSSGSFEFDIEESHVSEYRFRLTNNGYFGIEAVTPTDKIHQEEGYSPTFEMIQESFIELNVKNTMPQNTNDEIRYRYTNVEVQEKGCCNNDPISGIGYDYEAHHKCSVRSHAWINLTWTVSKSGNQVLHFDSIYSGDGSTVIYNINY